MEVIPISIIKNNKVLDVTINRYKSLQYDGDGFAIDLKPQSNSDGIGGIISRLLSRINVYGFSEKPINLNDFGKIALIIRAYDNNEFYPKNSKRGEFLITTENYKKLIDTTDDMECIKNEILKLLYIYFNQRTTHDIKSISIFCSLYFEIPKIIQALEILNRWKFIKLSDRNESPWGLSIELTEKGFNKSETLPENIKQKTKPNNKTALKNYDFFICHASEDKEIFVNKLADRLKAEGFNSWYDDFVLKWGDSLLRKVQEGLIKSRYGIVILSHNFFSKKWPQDELDGLYALEGEEKRILPLWLNIVFEEVKQFSPILAGRKALKSEDGLDKIIEAAKELF